MTEHELDLLTTGEAARAAGVDSSAIYRAACQGRLRVAAHTRSGTRLYHAFDVEEYRRGRVARLARALRAAAEPRAGEPWDAAQSAALDLAIAAEESEP
jgi:hypothetical protein